MGQRIRLTADQRFEAKVHRTDGCWIWTAALDADGYGHFWTGEYRSPRNPLSVPVHRWSYERYVGPIPDGLNVCHTCDNPPCVNPEHLFLGTQRDNVHDCIRKGRFVNGRAILTADQVAALRATYTGRHGQVADLARQYGVKRGVVDYALFRRDRHSD